MPHVRRLRMSNPRKRRKSNSRRRSRRNPVGEVLIVANPRKRSRKSYRRRSKASRRSNPFGKRHHIRRRGHRRSNPIAGMDSKKLLSLALGAGAGVLGSKYITQLALGDNNSGVVGYAGTAFVVIGLGWAAHKFAGDNLATGVVAGGLGALLLRIFQENVSGTSAAASMSGLGDPDMKALGVRGLGEFTPGSMPMPSMFSAPAPVVAAAPSRRRG